MSYLLANTLVRRLTTIPLVFVSLAIATLLAPLLALVVLAIDVSRLINARRPFMASRMAGFAWVYLLGEAWALLTMTLAGLFGRERSLEMTFFLQRLWTGWNYQALKFFFNLEFEVTGDGEVPPGPILLLSRHASMIDTMLPARFVVRPHGIKLKYVLKKELLVDPALDIGGNRLPNYFVDRGASDSEAERNGIRMLSADLQPDEGVLIYPEGTRYSEEKRIRFTTKLANQPGRVGEVAAGLRRVLPPRPGGTLALLEASEADVVLLMHRGLEGFARAKDIWSGDLIGSTITVEFRRIQRSQIPTEPEGQLNCLFDLWAALDDWVVVGVGPSGESEH